MFYFLQRVNKLGKDVYKRCVHTLPLPTLHSNESAPSTQIGEISTVIHNLSPTGGKEWQNGHFVPFCFLARLLLNSGGEFVDLVIDRTSFSHQLTDLAVGMHDRCVVTPAECLADLWKRELC